MAPPPCLWDRATGPRIPCPLPHHSAGHTIKRAERQRQKSRGIMFNTKVNEKRKILLG